jgi:hypothetical protein
MARPKGLPKTGGRKKNVENVLTADLKALAMNTLDAVGGQAWLEEVARKEPVAFLGFLGKFIPKDVNAAITGEVLHRISKIELIAPDVNGTDSTTT